MITMKTLHQYSAQEIFNQVATHLLTQMKRSVDDFGFCAYRGSNGLKCAAGCLIADDEYFYDFEGFRWSHLVTIGKVSKKHKEMIKRLQYVHDSCLVDEWYESLSKIANYCGLKMVDIEETRK